MLTPNNGKNVRLCLLDVTHADGHRTSFEPVLSKVFEVKLIKSDWEETYESDDR